ncbi:MAG: NADH-quinone oxidoreductase subunit H [Promethearchaeota archaeon]
MSAIKSSIQYIFGIVLISIIVAGLFVVFKDSSDALVLLKFFIFPGILFIFLGSLVINWFDRKIFARMQNRIGPRFIQPVYDLLKLLAKEDITADGVDEVEFNAIPPIQVILAFMVAFTTPVYATEGLISFEGDLVFILFLLAVIGASIFLLGWATNNPYGIIGGARAAVAEFSFEIPLALSFIGPAILAGSLRLSEILDSEYALLALPLGVFRGDLDPENLLYMIPLLVLLGMAILSTTAVLEKVPFDPAHAEVEIIGGWAIEISGKKLLFTRLANLILEFSLAGIIAAVFFGGPKYPTEFEDIILDIWTIGEWDVLGYLFSIAFFIIKMMIIVFFITSMRTLHSRIRIDQLVQYFWRYYLPITLAALFMIIALVGVI